MPLLTTHSELDSLGGGRYRHTQHMRPVAYADAGTLKRIVPTWLQGDAAFPHAIDAASFFSRITAQGDWRLYPTRDEKVWFSIGAPCVNAASPVRAALNSFARKDNALTSVNADFDVRAVHGGHFLKLEIPLKRAYVPPQGMLAFPMGSEGVDLKDGILLVEGNPVMQLRAPVVYDAANPMDVRPVATAFQSIGPQRYIVLTLPTLVGMVAPVVDPTLTLQPDATAGKDAVINGLNANTNYGTATAIDALVGAAAGDVRRGPFQFDLSSIASSAIVLSGVFTWHCRADTAAQQVNIHYLTRTWTEAGVTWNKYDGTNAWTIAGGDYDATVQASINPASYVSGTFYDFAIDTLVRAWVAGTITNNGLMGKCAAEVGTGISHGLAGDSSDHATAANRPKLVTIYSLPGRAPFCAPFQGPFG